MLLAACVRTGAQRPHPSAFLVHCAQPLLPGQLRQGAKKCMQGVVESLLQLTQAQTEKGE